LAWVLASGLPTGAVAEQAANPVSPAAGRLDVGGYHSCAVLPAGGVRCWGYGSSGQLGYGSLDTIGDDEVPASAGPVNLGPGRTATAIAAGDVHTCALLDDATVRCWGYGGDGRLGYGTTSDVPDPGSVGAVNLGPDRTARAITAGAAHTCALLDDGSVRCWGYGGGGLPLDGRLGYGNTDNVGDDETPGSVGPVRLGDGRTAVAISAGGSHTCALLDDGSVRCWGRNGRGQLGYGNTRTVGDTPTTTPDQTGAVKLGPHTAVAIGAGRDHTCVVLDDHSVRCWGYGVNGQLGYGSTDNVADTPYTTPDRIGPVNLGTGRTAVAITAGDAHTCVVLDQGSVRCWGSGGSGRLGYGNQRNIGDDEAPGSVGPVQLGSGRTAVAISAGREHTCARLDSGTVRCWGNGANGRLGYCNTSTIGDDESPGSVGPVNLEPGDGGPGCSGPPPPLVVTPGPSTLSRAAALRICLRRVARLATAQRRRARNLLAPARAVALRRITTRTERGRRLCRQRYGRTPGRVTTFSAVATGPTRIRLVFQAVGTDHANPPAARRYVIKQSTRPIRTRRDFHSARTLCHGSCAFNPGAPGATIALAVTDLRRHRSYYYAIAARDNVSGRVGPRSSTIHIRTS